MKITIAGCGALGSQIALQLAQPGIEFTLIDDDVVGPENLGTTTYSPGDIGKPKVAALGVAVHMRGAKVVARKITAKYKKDFGKPDLVIDCFDNVEARKITTRLDCPVLHVGVSGEFDGEGQLHTHGLVAWDEDYVLPEVPWKRGHNPICTNLLGRNILRFTATVATGAVEEFMFEEKKMSRMTTSEMKVLA